MSDGPRQLYSKLIDRDLRPEPRRLGSMRDRERRGCIHNKDRRKPRNRPPDRFVHVDPPTDNLD